MNNWVAVVDGGASGSRYALYDQQGKVVCTHEAGPASLTLGAQSAWHAIEGGVKSMIATVADEASSMPQKIVMGLAGSLQQEQREKFLSAIPDEVSASLYTDGYAQLIGAGGGRPGICLAAGTGTVIHWLNEKEEHHMAGGWGYPVGDDGSGAWLGMQLINDYLWYRDGERTFASDASDVFAELELVIGHSTSDIQTWSTCKESTRLASLVPMLAAFDRRRNAYVDTLITRGEQQCCRLIDLAPASLPLYVTGGLSALYDSGLRVRYADRMRLPVGDALSGLYLLSQTG